MSEAKDTQQHPKVEIAVENFGPIAEANIDLRPLTVFVGPSNTGKTYFATLVYALHSTFKGLSGVGLFSPFSLGNALSLLRNLFKNPIMSEGEIQNVLNKLHSRDSAFKLSDLSKGMHQKLGIITKDIDFFKEELQDELKNCFDLNSFLQLIRSSGGLDNDMAILLKVNEGSQEYWNFKIKVSESEINVDSSTALDGPTYKDMVILPKRWSIYGELLSDENSVRISGGGCPRMASRYYLPAARSGIMQSHRVIASSLITRTTRVGLEQFPEIPTLSGVIADFMQKIILYEDDKKNLMTLKWYTLLKC